MALSLEAANRDRTSVIVYVLLKKVSVCPTQLNPTQIICKHVATLGQGGWGSCPPYGCFAPPPPKSSTCIFSAHLSPVSLDAPNVSYYLITTMLVYTVTETVDIAYFASATLCTVYCTM